MDSLFCEAVYYFRVIKEIISRIAILKEVTIRLILIQLWEILINRFL